MLKIYLGNMEKAIYHPPTYFDNQYEDEWITKAVFRILSIQAILLVSASVQNHDRQSFVPFFRPSKVTVSTIVTLLPATIDFSPVALSAAVVWIVISGSYSSVSVPKSITVLFLETTTSKAGISVIPLLESQRNSSIV